MPDPNIKTWAAGQRLDAADLNSYLMRQTVIKTTNVGTAAPGSPAAGMTVYETSDATVGHGLKCYTTATTGWRPPWNLPWGVVAVASTTTATSGIGATLTLLNGLTLTATPPANRRLKISWLANMVTADTAARAKAVNLTDGSGTQLQACYWDKDANLNYTGQGVHYMVSTGSSMTWQVRANINANTTNTNFNSQNPGILLVEDIGPNAAPA